MPATKREHFGSRWAVIFAMAGSAIGLGNIWRFPYMVGEHGGAAFIILYLAATVLISLPVFIAEVSLGRRSRSNAFGAMYKLRHDSKIWKYLGFLYILVPLIIASYYSVIGGWSLNFLCKACTADFVRSDPETVRSLFGDFISGTWMPVIFHLLFFGACTFVVFRGVKSGIERFSKITIPVLFVLIVLMVAYSVTLPGAVAGVEYLMKPDFSQITPRSFAYALGQSFYSLSLGMGAIVTYGSYVHQDENIVVSGAGTAAFDLLFAIIAGFAIMPAVFAAGIEPGAGPGLVFQSIPFIFSSLGASLPVTSSIVSVIFFLTIVVAAMTSNISLIEVGVSFLVEHYDMTRRRACLVIFLLCGSLGVICALSYGPLAGITIGEKGIFDFFDWLSSNIFLPVLATITVVFVGFFLKKSDVRQEITNGGILKGSSRIFPFLYFLIKWVAPISMVILFITNFLL